MGPHMGSHSWCSTWTMSLASSPSAVSTPPRKVGGIMHSIETGARTGARRPALVPATLAAPAHPPSAAGCNGLANAEDTVSTRPQQQHTPGGHLQATVSDCHRLKVRYVSRNSPCADGRPSLPSAGAAFDARPCGQGQTMLSNTHNTATSMVSVRAHRAAPYSLSAVAIHVCSQCL